MKIWTAAGLGAAVAGLVGAGALLLLDRPARPVAPPVAAATPGVSASTVPARPTAAPAPAVLPPALAASAPTAAVPSPETFTIRRILPIKGPIRYGEWHWDDTGVPDGPLVITVDLDARVLSVFRAGYEIGATAVLLGTQEKPTPTGMFPITQKRERHISNLYGAPMPYMQRLTNDGVTIHATNVENGYASHGCIGTPLAFARKLFGVTRLGDRVIITRGKQAALGDNLAGT